MPLRPAQSPMVRPACAWACTRLYHRQHLDALNLRCSTAPTKDSDFSFDRVSTTRLSCLLMPLCSTAAERCARCMRGGASGCRYVSKGLAALVCEEPLTAQLSFEHKTTDQLAGDACCRHASSLGIDRPCLWVALLWLVGELMSTQCLPLVTRCCGVLCAHRAGRLLHAEQGQPLRGMRVGAGALSRLCSCFRSAAAPHASSCLIMPATCLAAWPPGLQLRDALPALPPGAVVLPPRAAANAQKPPLA